uniref:Dimer_Tnp_hAT domain-containing protein n=1 Tax=Syphacia muris TaxID=451379 RepID=A0A0N5AA39_9BILA
MSLATISGASEPKKLRLSLPTQVVAERSSYGCLLDGSSEVQSPVNSTCPLPSPNSATIAKDELDYDSDDFKSLLQNGQNIFDVLSTAMSFHTNVLFKYLQHQQQQRHNQQHLLHHGTVGQVKAHHRTPKSTTPTGPVIPGALAVAASPAAALFGEDDWSWHRNPAAAIRSGGTNKQTPVWKYFVYSKSENLSRCIVGDCTYLLKGPHTSTLACHLKKHPAEYAEFQKLKQEYTRERNGGQLPSSPSSSTAGSINNGISGRSRTVNNGCMIKVNRFNDPTSGVLNLSNKVPTNLTNKNSASNSILNAINGRNPDFGALNLQNTGADSLANLELLKNAVTAPQNAKNLFNSLNPKNGENLSAANFLSLSGALPNPGINGSRKWGREERKQKDMETRLALMLSATQIPTNIIENLYFREFIEYAQPKFTIPQDVQYLEEIMNTQHSRTVANIKNQISIAKKVAIMIDVLKIATPNTSTNPLFDDKLFTKDVAKDMEMKDSDSGFDASSDENQSADTSPRIAAASEDSTPVVRLCISAAYCSALTQRMEVALLGIRPLVEDTNAADSIRSTVNQVLSDYDISQDKVSRYIANGVGDLLDKSSSASKLFPRMLEPYNQKLTQSLLNVIDQNETVEELKKSFYSMVLNFMTKPRAMELLQEAAGRPVSLPITESFLNLIDAVLELKEPFLFVCSQLSLESQYEFLTEEKWELLDSISRLLKLFRTHMSVIQDGAYATIDGVVPSLMQLQLSLNKDFGVLGDLANQLKTDLRRRTASILDTSAPDFDGSFIQATALNHQLALLLDDEQLAYAKNAIEKQLNERMRAAEEVVARRNMKLTGGVDALLAAVVDRKASSNNSGSEASVAAESMATSSSLYPDLVHAANERRRIMQERQQNDSKNRYAEAIIQSYFDELASGTTQAIPNNPLASLTRSISGSLTNRQLSPLHFWQINAIKCGHLAEIAIELLTIPSSTVSLERIFITNCFTESADESFSQVMFDPISLLKSIDDPQRMERDVMLRFNRNLIPRV